MSNGRYVRKNEGQMTTTTLTIDEYAALPEQYDEHGNQLKDELIEGELIPSPRASCTHAEIVERVGEALKPLERWGCRVIKEGALPIFNDKNSVLGPDVMVVPAAEWYSQLANRAYNPIKPYFAIKPYLAVEVVSPGNRLSKLVRKTEMMLGLGTMQVWWIHGEQRRVDVYTRAGVQSFTSEVRVPHPDVHLVLELAPIFDFSKVVIPAHEE